MGGLNPPTPQEIEHCLYLYEVCGTAGSIVAVAAATAAAAVEDVEVKAETLLERPGTAVVVKSVVVVVWLAGLSSRTAAHCDYHGVLRRQLSVEQRICCQEVVERKTKSPSPEQLMLLPV